MNHPRLAVVALLAVAAAWGSTFFLTKDLLTRMDVADYLALRFLIASVALVLVHPPAIARLSRLDRGRAVALGITYGIAQLLQTEGLRHTAASVSGFVTGMYVVFTPLLAAVILRHKIGRWAWVAVILATVGLGVLSLRGVSMGPGELLTLASAGLYALHIIGLGAWSTSANAFGLSSLQMITITAVCAIGAIPGGFSIPGTGGDWVSVFYMALVSGALALIVQTWAQAHLTPTRAAIAMTMEPVFASAFAVLFGSESVTWRMLVGGALVLSAMYLVELAPRRKFEAEVQHLAQ
ncbi:threonine/homoserine efflux transporter RhtA [Kribbella antiqua]|uniref:Threonine/homoserine efflux transporter RhtA n=1 Tax=Kribbella antiqua TaxID=2512217 RepID=A0A4R2J151_9ACTN|nr:DMT family transporter [Kribbella antiqua]TCO51941.1 threonine/homoserine efflux transporter RhtA [Kribbella antiqua]